MIKQEKPNFVASRYAPNPKEVSYWIDLTESSDGQIIKTYSSSNTWVKVNQDKNDDQDVKWESLPTQLLSNINMTVDANDATFTIANSDQAQDGSYSAGDDISIELSAASTSQAGLMSAADKVIFDRLPEHVVDNVSLSRQTGGLSMLVSYVDLSSGNNGSSYVNLPLATITESGLLSAADKVKIDNIQSDINTAVAALVGSAPETLDTLAELADAINDDEEFATTVTTLIGQKLDTVTYNSDKATFATKTELNSKQDELVSGTSIKTINNTSLLGSGNVAVQPTLVSGTNIKTINGQSLLGSGDLSLTSSESDVFTIELTQLQNGYVMSDELFNNITSAINNCKLICVISDGVYQSIGLAGIDNDGSIELATFATLISEDLLASTGIIIHSDSKIVEQVNVEKDLTQFVTIDQLDTLNYISGIGITSIQVVSELPSEQTNNVLYIKIS